MVIAYMLNAQMQHAQMGPGVFMTMASIWMLLNVLRVLNSGWTLRIAADCTYKIAINAVALMGFCVNSMGGLHHLVALSLIPEKGGECEASYTETWRAVCNCLHKILKIGRAHV